MPQMTSAIFSSTLSTAFNTPLPRYLSFSPSRSSQASCSPVLAPLGTMARPTAPPASSTSTSTVGLTRESRTCRARTSQIIVCDIEKLYPELAASRKTDEQLRLTEYKSLSEPSAKRVIPALQMLRCLRSRLVVAWFPSVIRLSRQSFCRVRPGQSLSDRKQCPVPERCPTLQESCIRWSRPMHRRE